MNELKYMLEENEFRNVISRKMQLPQIDTIRDALKVIEADGLKYNLVHTVKKAIENKVFDNGTIDGYTVAAIDGTKYLAVTKSAVPNV